MEDNLKSISTDLFYKIRSRFSGLQLGSELGEVTINPEEAVFFDFDYMEGEKPLGHVSISLAEPSSMKVYYSTGIAENMDHIQKGGWYDFLKSLREFAKRRLMNFDTRDIAKDNLDKRDFAFLSQYSKPEAIGESVMNTGMYGTNKTSYQKLNDTKLIIKHSHALPEDMKPGARSRNISALFIENQDGERFKYPFIHLAGARAMQRHVANGGVPYDDMGQHIVKMSEQVAQLKSFSNYVVRNDLLNSETNGIIERGQQALQQTRETIQRLSKQGFYEQFKETFQAESSQEVPQDVIEDLTNKFTVKNFKEDIASVFPVLYRLMKENDTIGYDDIVAMTQQEEAVQEEVETGTESDFDQFESWVMNLGEDSALASRDQEERQGAIEKLNGMIENAFPAGTDGVNAIQALKGIIEDPALARAIREASKEDANTDVRPLIYQWAEANATEALSELDFGDMEQSSGAEEESTPEGEEHEQQSGSVHELAEFIYSFYDKETGEFPKGQTGVVTMVQKKFGEQAAHMAHQMIERMYQKKVEQQEAQQDDTQQLEMARIKSLAGL